MSALKRRVGGRSADRTNYPPFVHLRLRFEFVGSFAIEQTRQASEKILSPDASLLRFLALQDTEYYFHLLQHV